MTSPFDRAIPNGKDMFMGFEFQGQNLTLEDAVFQALGHASMCWEERSHGEFDSSRAKMIGDILVAFIRNREMEANQRLVLALKNIAVMVGNDVELGETATTEVRGILQEVLTEPVPENQFLSAIQEVVNRHSQENRSNTPDYVLAEFVVKTLDAANELVRARDRWYDQDMVPGHGR